MIRPAGLPPPYGAAHVPGPDPDAPKTRSALEAAIAAIEASVARRAEEMRADPLGRIHQWSREARNYRYGGANDG